SIDLGHNYDGIRELDNSLPPWWKWGFYFTIAWGLVYVWHFHVSEIALAKVLFGPGISSAEEYNIAMKEADEQKEVYLAKVGNQIDEKNVTLVTDAEGLANGKTIFTTNCVVCHGANGEGGVGPNLTDKFWIHGGSVNKVFATIEYGVPAKGMIPWLGQLKPKEIQNVASYILSLQGTNPANPKAPEGTEYIPAPADSITAPADTAKAVAMNKP
ncbi:MAG: cytochrome C oxidase subunit III, partial [Bacteroidetes bacterium]